MFKLKGLFLLTCFLSLSTAHANEPSKLQGLWELKSLSCAGISQILDPAQQGYVTLKIHGNQSTLFQIFVEREEEVYSVQRELLTNPLDENLPVTSSTYYFYADASHINFSSEALTNPNLTGEPNYKLVNETLRLSVVDWCREGETSEAFFIQLDDKLN